jgi:hypothetical protein
MVRYGVLFEVRLNALISLGKLWLKGGNEPRVLVFRHVYRNYILEVTEEKWLRCSGHVNRMPGNILPRKVLEWKPEGTRRREDPKRDGA